MGYTRRRITKQKQSRETGNIGYTRRRETKQTQCNMCSTRRTYAHRQTHTNAHTHTHTHNVNKTGASLQTTGGKDESNIVFMQKSLQTSHQKVKSHKGQQKDNNALFINNSQVLLSLFFNI